MSRDHITGHPHDSRERNGTNRQTAEQGPTLILRRSIYQGSYVGRNREMVEVIHLTISGSHGSYWTFPFTATKEEFGVFLHMGQVQRVAGVSQHLAALLQLCWDLTITLNVNLMFLHHAIPDPKQTLIIQVVNHKSRTHLSLQKISDSALTKAAITKVAFPPLKCIPRDA